MLQGHDLDRNNRLVKEVKLVIVWCHLGFVMSAV
jgi:hypothetical protein